MIIIGDTSPISNLLAIDHIHLLPALYSQVVIPNGVAEELLRVNSRMEQIKSLLLEGWLQVKVVTDWKLYEEILVLLDKGESEAIALGIEMNADLLLMDETKGRQLAKDYGLKVTGLLGILIEAKTKAFIISVKDLLDGLIEKAGFYVDRNLYDSVLKAAGEA